MKVAAVLGTLLLLLLAPPAASQAPSDKLVIPGQRIGKWTLEMTIEMLVQMNGPQDAGGRGAPISPMPVWFSDSGGDVWWHEWSKLYFSAATRGRDAQRIEYLFTWDGDFKTDKNVATGMAREVVEGAYGQPTAVTRTGGLQNPGGWRLIYDEIGLAVLISRNGVAEMLFVYRPRTARTLWN